MNFKIVSIRSIYRYAINTYVIHKMSCMTLNCGQITQKPWTLSWGLHIIADCTIDLYFLSWTPFSSPSMYIYVKLFYFQIIQLREKRRINALNPIQHTRCLPILLYVTFFVTHFSQTIYKIYPSTFFAT